MPDVRFELARPQDAATIGLLSRDLVEFGLNWRWTPRAVFAQIRHPETEVIVARLDSCIIGFAIMQFDLDDAHLVLLAVRPEVRGRGLGRGLLAWLERSVHTAGIERIRLEVRASNQAAQRFYRNQGFDTMARLRGYYQGREDAILMMKTIWMPVATGDATPPLR